MSDTLEKSTGITNLAILLDKMIESKADPDALKKMMDLYERFEANRSRKAYVVSMNTAQAEIHAVVKRQPNTFLGGMYATLEAIQDVAKPVYIRHGFSLTWTQADHPREGWVRLLLKVSHKDGHTEVCQGDYPQDGTGAKGGKNMNPIQGVVSACTYGQRNMLQMAFNITVTGEDRDGNYSNGNGGTISLEQIGQLDDLIVSSGVNRERFMAWCSESAKTTVETLDQLPTNTFQKAHESLVQIKAKRDKKEGVK